MIHIIIPVHNGWAETRNCLISLQAQTFQEFTVYVVDDGSTDGTATSIAREFPTVHVVLGSGNLWWTGATKKGAEIALQRAAMDRDYLMTLNNDVVLRSNALAELHDFVTANPGSIANALSLDAVDQDTVVSSGNRIVSWMLNISIHPFHGRSYAKVDKRPVEVDMLNGRSTMIPVDVFARCGDFDSERFPHYGGDVEFTLRAKRSGWRLFLVPSALVFLNQRTTGLNAAGRRLTTREIMQSFVSIKSSSNLAMRTRLALRCCPWYAIPSYTLIMYLKIFGIAMIGNAYIHLTRKRVSS